MSESAIVNYFEKHTSRTDPFLLFFLPWLFAILPLYLSHLKSLFSDLIFVILLFLSLSPHIVSFTRAFFFLRLSHILYLSSSTESALCANWYYSGTPLEDNPLMYAFRCSAHFHARSTYADANACTRGGDGNHVNFDKIGTYW